MTDGEWRPLGLDTDEEIASYDALHDGLPPWLEVAYWAWVRSVLSIRTHMPASSGYASMLRVSLTEEMCQVLRIRLPDLRTRTINPSAGRHQLDTAISALASHAYPLQVADFLLAHAENPDPGTLDALLHRGKSAWTVGTRQGKSGLVRRVPEGVQLAADSIMARAGRAGVRLASAWEALYGLTPNPSEAYRLAILAIEDAAIPVVTPDDDRATLGTVIRTLERDGDWRLPMEREYESAPSNVVIVSAIRLIWQGQHDRHGGQPSAPGDVSAQEAAVAVSVAVLLVGWFSAGLVTRESETLNGD